MRLFRLVLVAPLLLQALAPGAARTPAYSRSLRDQPVVYPGVGCPTQHGSQAEADQAIAAFERAYPAALVDPATVERRTVAPAVLTRIIANLPCLAALPGGDPFVAEQASALFASRAHGRAAFAALDRLAATDPRAARFARQMRAYVRR